MQATTDANRELRSSHSGTGCLKRLNIEGQAKIDTIKQSNLLLLGHKQVPFLVPCEIKSGWTIGVLSHGGWGQAFTFDCIYNCISEQLYWQRRSLGS